MGRIAPGQGDKIMLDRLISGYRRRGWEVIKIPGNLTGPATLMGFCVVSRDAFEDPDDGTQRVSRVEHEVVLFKHEGGRFRADWRIRYTRSLLEADARICHLWQVRGLANALSEAEKVMALPWRRLADIAGFEGEEGSEDDDGSEADAGSDTATRAARRAQGGSAS